MKTRTLTKTQERVILKGLYERCDDIKQYNLLADGGFLAVYDGHITIIINNKGHNTAPKDEWTRAC